MSYLGEGQDFRRQNLSSQSRVRDIENRFQREADMNKFNQRMSECIRRAGDKYRKLDYNPLYESYEAVRAQISQVNDFLTMKNKDEKELRLAATLMKDLNVYMGALKTLEKEIGFREDHTEAEDQNKTALEIFHESENVSS